MKDKYLLVKALELALAYKQNEIDSLKTISISEAKDSLVEHLKREKARIWRFAKKINGGNSFGKWIINKNKINKSMLNLK